MEGGAVAKSGAAINSGGNLVDTRGRRAARWRNRGRCEFLKGFNPSGKT
jgi:hypothetical protein